MKKLMFIFLILLVFVVSPINTYALSTADMHTNILAEGIRSVNDLKDYGSNQGSGGGCDSLLGSTGDSNSVAWLLQFIFNIVKVVGALLVVVLSSIDFAKVVVKSDDDEMAKARSKLITRLILAAAIFFIPTITMVLLEVFGVVSDPTCGIQ